jgi:hypothetical protein
MPPAAVDEHGDTWRVKIMSAVNRDAGLQLVLDLPVAADPVSQGGQVGVMVAGDEVDDLDGLLAVLGDRAAQLRDLALMIHGDRSLAWDGRRAA